MIFCSFINGIHPSTHVFTHMFSPRGSYDRLCGAVATLLRPHWLGRVSGDPLPPGAGLSGVPRAPVSSTLCPATRKLSLQHRADHGLSCSQPFQGSSCPCDKARCPGARPAPPSSLRVEPLLSPLFSAWTLECAPGARPPSVQSQGGAPPVTAVLRMDPGVLPGSPARLCPVSGRSTSCHRWSPHGPWSAPWEPGPPPSSLQGGAPPFTAVLRMDSGLKHRAQPRHFRALSVSLHVSLFFSLSPWSWGLCWSPPCFPLCGELASPRCSFSYVLCTSFKVCSCSWT